MSRIKKPEALFIISRNKLTSEEIKIKELQSLIILGIKAAIWEWSKNVGYKKNQKWKSYDEIVASIISYMRKERLIKKYLSYL